jgi:hypothetical protein
MTTAPCPHRTTHPSIGTFVQFNEATMLKDTQMIVPRRTSHCLRLSGDNEFVRWFRVSTALPHSVPLAAEDSSSDLKLPLVMS